MNKKINRGFVNSIFGRLNNTRNMVPNNSTVAANYKWRLFVKSTNLYVSAQLNQIKQILFGIYKGGK